MDPTVLILGADSGVDNLLNEQGMTFAELGPASDYRNPARYFVKVNELSKKLVEEGLITTKESRQIFAAALQSVNNAKSHR